MTDLRKYAEGKECQVRLHVCNFDRSTTVLAHLRLIGISGMGMKSPDIFGAHCCSACHQYSDTHHDIQTKLWFLQGVVRTINLLVKEGIVTWAGSKKRLPPPDPQSVVAPEDLIDEAGPGRYRS